MRRILRTLVAGWIAGVTVVAVSLLAEEPSPSAERDRPATEPDLAAPTGPLDQVPGESDSATASAEQIADWLRDLDDSRYLVREQATQNIINAGAAALDSLLSVANGDRPEPADRATWILQRFGRSHDNDLALAALERLVQLQNRPKIVSKAESDLAERSVAMCEEQLTPLGAELSLQVDRVDATTEAPILVLRLGKRWRGGLSDLQQVSKLRQQRFFRLAGEAVNDDVVRLFAEKEKLSVLQLFDTKVTPAAVDAIKARHPNATVYVRNQALLGVSADPHTAGVIVMFVQAGTAAATAGIQPGDVISKIDGKQLPDFDRLTARIASHQPGDTIDVEIIRNEQPSVLKVTLGSRPPVE